MDMTEIDIRFGIYWSDRSGYVVLKRTLEIWSGKAIECSELTDLLRGTEC